AFLSWNCGGNKCEFLRMTHRQRLQHHDIDERKDSGVSADSERQRQHCDERKSRRPSQGSQCVSQVLLQYIEERDSTSLAILLFGLLDSAQANHRLPARLVRRHASADIVVDVHLKMAFHLRRQIVFQTSPAKWRKET